MHNLHTYLTLSPTNKPWLCILATSVRITYLGNMVLYFIALLIAKFHIIICNIFRKKDFGCSLEASHSDGSNEYP